MIKTITNRNQLVLSVLLTIGAIGGIKSGQKQSTRRQSTGNTGAAAAPAMGRVQVQINTGAAPSADMRRVQVQIYNALTGDLVCTADNVDRDTLLNEVVWVPKDSTKPLRLFDDFKRVDMNPLLDFDKSISQLELDRGIGLDDVIIEMPPNTGLLDPSQSIRQLMSDSGIGPDDVIRINVIRRTRVKEALKTENPLRNCIDRMSEFWNIKDKEKRQAILQRLQDLIDCNERCLPDMEPMNKLLEVFARAFDQRTELTREHFKDWLGYMETEQLQALEFLMCHFVYVHWPYTEPDIVDLSRNVLQVLKSMNPMERKITVVYPDGTESEKKINFNAPFWVVCPWASDLKLLDLLDQGGLTRDEEVDLNYHYPKKQNLNLWREKFGPKTKIQIMKEISDPKEYVLEKLQVQELQGDVLEKLREVKAVVAAELRVVQTEGASFRKSNYSGPEYNKILSTIMTCLIELYDKLLEAEGNTQNLGAWVDDMIKENPLLLRLMTYYFITTLCGCSTVMPITEFIGTIADFYFETTYLPRVSTNINDLLSYWASV